MRMFEKNLLQISEDNDADPKQIVFSNDTSSEDLTSCSEVKVASDIFPIGTTVVSMGNIAAGKFLFVKPALDCTLVLGGENISLRAGKESKLWASFASVSIIEATAPNKISMVIAGD